MAARILIVDDELNMQVALREVLQRQQHEVTVASDGPAALAELESGTFDLVLTDVRMPEMTGIQLLERIRSRWPQVSVLVMTAYGTVEDAVGAMKKGASDYLLKPFSSETVEEVVHRTLQRARKAAETGESDDVEEEETGSSNRAMEPVANSAAMQQLLAVAREVADSTATILIQGESGTGKEVLARYIHGLSGRRQKPFVALNCAALPEGLLESELFGHEKGAFTGAVLSRKGKFELANHGTLLLDEVS
ncbi:MAG: sigma-54-dependent transcriptional regulator, partial [Candidatus Sumerlaeota bacterium]